MSVTKNNSVEVAERDLSEILSAIYKAVLELVSSGAPFPDVLQVLTRTIEEQSPGLLCSILLLDNIGKTLQHGAAPSLPEGYIQAIDGMAIGPCAGSCGTAAYRGEPVIVSDIASDPLWVGYRDLGLSHGLRACWSTPIFSGDGKVLGAFAMYYREARRPDSCDLQIIERATHLAAIAIERERAEQALRQAEDKYRSIVENAVEGFFQTTPAGGYISVNLALARMYGYESPGELMAAVGDIGRQVYVDPNRRAEFKRVMEEHGLAQEFEYQVYRNDGRKIWLSENARAVRDANGAVLYYEGTVVDITERKQLEDQLRQTQKMEAVGRLAGGVAHDFNNLLMVILGHADLLRQSVGRDDPYFLHIEQIQKAAERAKSLTQQLLAYSRRQVIAPTVLDLNFVVAEMGKMLPRLVGEDIELVTLTNATRRQVKVDRGQIEQVILNLVINARDAMPKGGRLTIETANVALDEAYASRHAGVQPGPYVMLAVSDTGCGMDVETQSHIFEPFFTTKEKGKGTGLGLATVYGVVKQSGGNIWVYSEPGRGTTLKIYLPQIGEVVEETSEGQALSEFRQGSGTVLLVEDEEAVRELVRDGLQRNGFTVLEAKDGVGAIHISEKHPGPIHLMITDVVMPRMSGRELAHRLATQRPNMKVLYMSGYTDNAIVHHGVLDPGTVFIQKPFGTNDLVHKLQELLDGATGSQ